MTLEPEKAIQSVEQATEIRHLLTQKGMDARFAPFISGKVVREESGDFFGKQSVLTALSEQLKSNGIAVLEGGYRGGKTSLLEVVGERAVKENLAQSYIHIDLMSYPSVAPERIIKRIHSELNEVDGGKAVIAIDEIGAYDRQNQLKLLELIEQLKAEGHKIVFSVIGDLHGDSQKELPRETKDKLLIMTGNNVVVNELLDESEMKELLSQRGESLFTEPLIKHLTAQAGGHPLLAQALAGSSFSLLKYGDIEPAKFAEELKSEISESVLNNFDVVVDTVIVAGFDPLTWEWKGKGEKPDVTVYSNMLPRYTSTIFKDWLTEYIKGKK